MEQLSNKSISLSNMLYHSPDEDQLESDTHDKEIGVVSHKFSFFVTNSEWNINYENQTTFSQIVQDLKLKKKDF